MKLIILLSASFALACCQSCPKEGVEYYPDSTYCDRYSECREGVPSDGHQCPDGLLFNEKVTNGRNPCDYPTEVDCEGRNKKQTPQPTENCPNKWGYFSSGSRSECGYFFNCVDGRDFLFNCPAGLAFSSLTYSVDTSSTVSTGGTSSSTAQPVSPSPPSPTDVNTPTRAPTVMLKSTWVSRALPNPMST